jgi:hypothetical protein
VVYTNSPDGTVTESTVYRDGFRVENLMGLNSFESRVYNRDNVLMSRYVATTDTVTGRQTIQRDLNGDGQFDRIDQIFSSPDGRCILESKAASGILLERVGMTDTAIRSLTNNFLLDDISLITLASPKLGVPI